MLATRIVKFLPKAAAVLSGATNEGGVDRQGALVSLRGPGHYGVSPAETIVPSELERIANALITPPPAGGVPVLATLMSVAGSAYRGPGARMVLLPDGARVGSISGGCLEADIVAHCDRVRGSGTAQCVSYDLTSDDDAPWGLNLGCNAKLDVLLEPCGGGLPGYLRAALEALAARSAVVISTAFEVSGGSVAAVGERAMMIGNDGRVNGALAEGALGGMVRVDANRVMDEERSDVVRYRTGSVEAQVLHEYLPRPVRLLVCGEGGDVAPVLRLGEELGWQVAAIGRDTALPEPDDRTAAVIMTHNFGRDLDLLGRLLPSRAGYVGLLGPRARTEKLLAHVASGGSAPNFVALQRLHAPVGLDIGADTPEEVALAIVAEVRAQLGGRAGGKLRDRKGPIHERR